MRDSDKAAFAAYLVAMAEVFDAQLSETKISLYFEALKDLSLDEVDRACSQLVRSARFFPKPGELLEAARGSSEDAAQVALGQLKHAMRSVGGYRSVSFEDSVIPAVVQTMGGWEKLCSTPESEWRWLEKDFLKLYRAYSAQGIQGPAQLSGITDHANELMGYTPELMDAMGLHRSPTAAIGRPGSRGLEGRALPSTPDPEDER